MKTYRLIVANQTFEIGEQLEGQPFRLFTYEHLGIKTDTDWMNLFKVHLYQDRIQLKTTHKMNAHYFQSIDSNYQYSAGDILAYANRGYQVLKKNVPVHGQITELFRAPSGKIVDDLDQECTLDGVLDVIHQPKGFVLVPHA